MEHHERNPAAGGDAIDRSAVNGDDLRPLGRGGLTVGRLAFGAAPIGNLGRAVSEADAEAAAQAAWAAGIRYFDTAPHYGLGLSERRLGRALAPHPRAEMIISTKVGRVLVPVDDHDDGARDDEGFDVPRTVRRVLDYSRDGVMRSLEESLHRLGTDRIDIVFVHDPDDHEREALDGAFPALEELRSQGVIRSYGAGMNQSAMLTRFVRATDLDVVMLAGRYSLIDQSGLDDLLPALDRRVSVAAAGVFNSGLLSRDGPTAGLTYNYAPASNELLVRARRLAGVCRSHGVTLPQAAVHFVLRHPAVATVVLGARTADQVERNTALLERSVPESLWHELGSLGLVRTTVTDAAG